MQDGTPKAGSCKTEEKKCRGWRCQGHGSVGKRKESAGKKKEKKEENQGIQVHHQLFSTEGII